MKTELEKLEYSLQLQQDWLIIAKQRVEEAEQALSAYNFSIRDYTSAPYTASSAPYTASIETLTVYIERVQCYFRGKQEIKNAERLITQFQDKIADLKKNGLQVLLQTQEDETCAK